MSTLSPLLYTGEKNKYVQYVVYVVSCVLYMGDITICFVLHIQYLLSSIKRQEYADSVYPMAVLQRASLLSD